MSAAAPPSATPNEAVPVERRCENPDCNAPKLLSKVPKRKISQFVIEPNVMEKPMLINGFTTVFQVDGSGAKLSDLKNVPSNGAAQPKTIYRIVPDTHAHIVNYVVVDAEGAALRKINESDPATMRKLLESQKASADQMLLKLIAGVSVTGGVNNSNGVASAHKTSTVAPINAGTSTTLNTKSQLSSVAGTASPSSPSLGQIQLPVRMHPNLKITAVAGAETAAAAMNAMQPAIGTTTTTLPMITPVPLASLQSQSLLRPIVPTVAPTAVNVDTVEKPVFDKMQAELQELRRTVAMLAEAQAKNQMNQQQQPSHQQTAIVPTPNTGVAAALRATKRLRQS